MGRVGLQYNLLLSPSLTGVFGVGKARGRGFVGDMTDGDDAGGFIEVELEEVDSGDDALVTLDDYL